MGKIFLFVVAISIAACGSRGGGDAQCAPRCVAGAGTIVFDAGPKIIVFEGEQVILLGSARNPDNLDLQIEWKQVAGPVIPIVDADRLTASFVAPFLAVADFSEKMGFHLTVTASDGSFGFDVVDVVVERTVAFAPSEPATAVFPHVKAGPNESAVSAEALFFTAGFSEMSDPGDAQVAWPFLSSDSPETISFDPGINRVLVLSQLNKVAFVLDVPSEQRTTPY
jgi:hypothetical protein